MGVLVQESRHAALVEFIADAMLTDDDPPRKPTAMALQYIAGAAPQEINSVRFLSRKWEAKELADKFWRAVKNHSGGTMGGMQSYRVVVLYGEAEPERQFPISVEGDLGLKNGTMGTEGPTTTGQTMQMQRHAEAMVRLVAQMANETATSAATLMNSANETLKQLREQNAKLMVENHEAIQLAKEVILENAQRKQERELELRRFDRASVEREQVLRMLPALVNQITGQEIFPQSLEDSAIIETLEKKLSGEQIEQLAGIIGGEGMAVIAPRLMRATAKREAEEAKQKARAMLAAKQDE